MESSVFKGLFRLNREMSARSFMIYAIVIIVLAMMMVPVAVISYTGYPSGAFTLGGLDILGFYILWPEFVWIALTGVTALFFRKTFVGKLPMLVIVTAGYGFLIVFDLILFLGGIPA